MIGETAIHLAAEFRFIQQLNTKVERSVYHASLSLVKTENLDDDTWNEIADEYMNGMGFDYNQYVIYRHHDCDHDHIHIAANRVRIDGKCVSDSWDYPKAEVVIRNLEQKYNLTPAITRDELKKSPTTGERRLTERTGEPSVRQQLQAAIDQQTTSPTSLPELINNLESAGITATVIYTRERKVKGITYEVSGITFSGTQLGAGYSYGGLQKYKGVNCGVKSCHPLTILANPEGRSPLPNNYSPTPISSIGVSDNQSHQSESNQIAQTIWPIIQQAIEYAKQKSPHRISWSERGFSINIGDEYEILIDAEDSNQITLTRHQQELLIVNDLQFQDQGLTEDDLEFWQLIEDQIEPTINPLPAVPKEPELD